MDETQKVDAELPNEGTEKGDDHQENDKASDKPLDNDTDNEDDSALFDDPEGFVDEVSDEGNGEAHCSKGRV